MFDLEASPAPDGLTLHFVSNRPLESDGKAKDFDSMEDFYAEVFKYDNGMSRIYMIPLAEMLK